MALRYGTRLSRLFTEQIAALEKYRGKGQQTVVVKRADVGQGAQGQPQCLEARILEFRCDCRTLGFERSAQRGSRGAG